jgi:hypothetical protein
MGLAVPSGGGSVIPETYGRDSWRVSALVLQMWASSSCILLFCWGEEVVEMSQEALVRSPLGVRLKDYP